ncbi:MAG: NAD+ synthase [Nitrososphaerota archaeon]|nr:NAD+ synthase [Nitrososphaerota archaeon]
MAPHSIASSKAPLSRGKSKVATLNIADEISRISSFIRGQVSNSHTRGVIVGISGGIDSAVVASLCSQALGKKRVLGVFLFEERSRNSDDYSDARLLATTLNIRTLDFCITPIVHSVSRTLASCRQNLSRLTLANIKARTRMIILYALANEHNLLVAGTGDRSEELLGYFTKYGDGGVDFLPIGHLYKTEVRALGSVLRIPYSILMKPSSPNLWPGHKATHELPADYDVLDKVMTALFDSKRSSRQIEKDTKVSRTIIRKIIDLNASSKHKRQLPKLVVS